MNGISNSQFDRDSQARWYAARHLKTDPGVTIVYYLPTNAPDREIRFVEVNHLIAETHESQLEPLDFGVDIGSSNGHTLYVLDVTPTQWERVRNGTLSLPSGWTLDRAIDFRR